MATLDRSRGISGKWSVGLKHSVAKEREYLPRDVDASLIALIKEIEVGGPVRGNWPNYSKLNSTTHHCHLKKGKPTYVAVWEVVDKRIRIVEVIYAGTHEKAPY
jgi:hypothetical protein